MKTRIDGHNETKIGVSIWDNENNSHKIEVGFDGEIIFHGTDDYPHEREDRTKEEQRIMSQVAVRARYAAQQEFPEKELVPFEWNPDELEKVVTAIENHPEDAFERDFQAFYDAIQQPPVERPRADVDLVMVGVRLGEGYESIEHVTEPVVGFREDGEVEVRGPESEVGSHLTLNSPVYEFEWAFGEEFREFLVLLAKCHVRDAYLHMGEEPPEAYMVKGFGKMQFFGMEQYDDVRFPDAKT